MNLKNILTNRQLRSIIHLYKNTDDRIENSDSSLLDELNTVRLKDKITINRSSEESVLMALFPILISVSYVILFFVFYNFYFSSDVARFQRSASIFIISIISLSTLYAYRGNLFALKTLNGLNTLSIILAITLILLDYFVYYMHHEWYLLTIVFFNFLSNRIIINSEAFSQAMRKILWFKIKNSILKKNIVRIAEENIIELHNRSKKVNIFNIFWQYCVLNTNLNNTLRESYALNQRVEKNDASLLAEKRLNKYRYLLDFDIPKKALLITLFSTILLIKSYVMTTFILLSHLDNKNDLPILFFIVALALVFAFLSISLTHRGITLGFRMLTVARYLFVVLFISLISLKFIAGVLDYSNVFLCIISVDFLLTFFMLNTQYYSHYLKELHCFQAWHKMIRKNSQ
ncbi:hypothetical protein HGO23_00865 [Xenorhabdus budapestensis]|uniref:Uncharacterized protein n=1 Tax=Xenorhabdus budapestensis TaxID=290110 RepID=A0ABX7VKH5_XENBU|nr:hypothetical protein [Xenorhabdus budapestensis]QTL40025.1 hypothetical protein HGO23_00865 [Xenorhabdus budapestensis]